MMPFISSKSMADKGVNQRGIKTTSCTLASVLLLSAGTAFAAGDGEQPKKSRLSSMLEEVVVTARKREEGLQDAPLAVTAFTGDSLEVRGVTNIAEIGGITPNLTYQSNPQAGGSSSVATVYIRGIGQRDFLGTIDNGVGFYIDDVYIARTVGATVDLLDVERVEILRGPQGTLFGRNNVGGAVALHSKKPTEEFGGYVDGTVGTDSLTKLRVSVNAPMTDNLLSNFSAQQTTQDGYVDRPAGGDLGDKDTTALRGGLLWQATDDLEIHLTADYSKDDDNGPAFVLNSAGTLAPGGFAGFYNNVTVGGACAYPGGINTTNPACYNDQWTSDSKNLGTAPTYSETDVWGATLRISWAINDDLSLKSITAYRDLESEFARDADASPHTVVHFFDSFESEQFSQELQLSGTAFDGKLDWITGLYYFDEDGNNNNILEFAIATFDSDNDFTTTSQAVFTQGTFHATDALDITLGLRYTDEEKTFDPVQVVLSSNIGVPPGALILPLGKNTRTTYETTPMLNIAYNISDDLMLYATYSEGFRSGGYVQRIFPPLPIVPDFDPEFVDAYEVGFKYNNQDGTFSLNGAFFQMDYTDIQVRTQNPGFVGFFESNVGDAEITGFELETKWQVADTWFFESSVGYTNAKYTKIDVQPPLIAQVTTSNDFDHVPEWSVSASVSKEFDLGDNGSLVARLSGNYHSGYFNNPDNTPTIATPELDLWDATLVWNSADETYSANLGVKNLTDEDYLATGYNNTAIGTVEHIFDRGRQWYLSARYNF